MTKAQVVLLYLKSRDRLSYSDDRNKAKLSSDVLAGLGRRVSKMAASEDGSIGSKPNIVIVDSNWKQYLTRPRRTTIS